jgi:hypothetical protein
VVGDGRARKEPDRKYENGGKLQRKKCIFSLKRDKLSKSYCNK